MTKSSPLTSLHLEGLIASLLRYCQERDWSGYDPYDALNSRLLDFIPGGHSRLPRLVMIQLLKRCPLNIRPILGIKPTQNPKGLALFLSASIKLKRLGLLDDPSLPEYLVNRLSEVQSPGVGYSSWGYSFPWQTRTVLVPRGAPNLVCTTFVAGSLLDAYEEMGDSRCLEMSVSAARHILQELYWSNGPVASFSYPLPSVRVPVHNANFLAASLLCRVGRFTRDAALIEPALRVARYSADCQLADGSWPYGEAGTQKWVDNFHTGFNLCALDAIGRDAGTTEFDERVLRGFEFYCSHFLAPDGAAHYFHNRRLPVDAHSVAQSIITLLRFHRPGDDCRNLAIRTLNWAERHLWSQRGYFYYQQRRFIKVRIPYMRWTQAWMLLALATLAESLAAGAHMETSVRPESICGNGI